ncbi:hypothetical protein [Anaerococcus sp. AGMB09787]|uniref:hypothetical protein n=1 Tax=Anaerococcus sp. AGMB09787 TaxID=2922869 RepID=UPI001FAFEB02|nr:hypothetical protein [Anaerococcus sp. AGMB09787]
MRNKKNKRSKRSKRVRPVVICKACAKRSEDWERLKRERKKEEFMKFVVDTGNSFE